MQLRSDAEVNAGVSRAANAASEAPGLRVHLSRSNPSPQGREVIEEIIDTAAGHCADPSTPGASGALSFSSCRLPAAFGSFVSFGVWRKLQPQNLA